MGKSGNNSTFKPGGDINNSSTRDSEGSINQSVILMTALRRQIKSGDIRPTEESDGAPGWQTINRRNFYKKTPMLGGKLLLERTKSSTTNHLRLYWGTTPTTTLLEEQPQQRSEERRYHQTRNMNECLTCWESCHPRESTEIFLSILSILWMFTLFKTKILKNWFV